MYLSYMGNSQSSIKKKKSLSQIIDYIATNYILTQNFQDMTKLSDMKYCNDLVILTSKIIANNLSDLEVQYLAQRIKKGVEINEMSKDRVIYLDKENLKKLDVHNKTQKKRLCISIAKYYVKIAHVFAAIVTTINPTYTYKDSTGAKQQLSLMEKQLLPKNAKTKIKRINICSQRLNALINNQDFNVSQDTPVTIKPKFCNINHDEVTGKERHFSTEPGIPELEKLYYNEYNYDQGGFTGMTDKMRKNIYEKDVESFYKTFTGNTKLPVDANGKKFIKTFSQIPLRDFHKSKGCEKNGVFTKGYKSTLKEKLFKKYAEHVKKMMMTTEKNQNKLLSVIDKMFVFSINPETQLKEVVINPKMDEKALQEIVETSRKLIVELYLKCENDFLEGLEIFEAIVEKQILDTSKEQIKELETTIESTLETPAPETPAPETPAPETPAPETPAPETPAPETPAPETVAPETVTSETLVLEPDTLVVTAEEGPIPEVSSSSVEVDKETRAIEKQMLDTPVTMGDAEVIARLQALGGGSPKGVIVGGTKYI
jgi:hypothetical protein